MTWLALGGATLAVAVSAGQKKYSYGGPDSTRGLSRNPALLLPAFADRLELLFQALRKRGFDPMLWEGWRSKERAKMLAATGKGIEDTLHNYGAAVDIVSASKLWSDPKFFKALAEESKKLGLYPGYDWEGDEHDPPHVQAVPGTRKAQDALRASSNPNELIKRYIG